MLVGGRRKNRSVKNKVKRGGCGGCVLSPASLTDGVSTLPASQMYSNSAKMPDTFSSKQVGGSYGFASTKDVFGGSYATPSTMCTGANADPSRGGNNFMSGGRRKGGTLKRRNAMKRTGGKRSSKKGGKRSSKKGGKRSSKKGGRKSRRKGGSKKWRQRGCNKKSGGMILL
jgi:hypothetical protein